MPPHRTFVFKEIDRRLREYKICIEQHVADDPRPAIFGQLPQCNYGKIEEGSSTLVGITFRPRNFYLLRQALLSATRDGLPAFHNRAKSDHGMWRQVWRGVKHLDLLDASYAATETNMPGEAKKNAEGFREITNLSSLLDDRPLSMSDVQPDRRFAARFAPPPERKIDITSLHIAITPEACNIHIDQVGFVLRGPHNMIGLSADFLQHLVNELAFKTWGRGILGEWVTDHFNIIVPSSDNGFSPTVGVRLDLAFPKQDLLIGAALTFGCGCLPSERLTIDEMMVPIPKGGWSVGVGLTKKVNWLGG